MTKNVLDLANLLDIIVDPLKTQVPDGGFASVMTDTWADLKVGVLDPTVWKLPASDIKPNQGATEQMVRWSQITLPPLLIVRWVER